MQLIARRPMTAPRKGRAALHRSSRLAKLGATLALALAVMSLAACDTQTGRQPEPASQENDTLPATVPRPDIIAANGILVPLRRITLSFGTSGYVASLAAEVGAEVRAGEILAALDSADLQQTIIQETLNVDSARGHLAVIQAQAQPVAEKVLAATAAISSAQTTLAQAEAIAGQQGNQSILDQAALTQARQALRDADSAYQQLLDSSVTRDWAPYSPAAKAVEDAREHYRLTLAEYSLHTADRGPEVAIANAEAQLAQARLSLYETLHPVAPEAVALADLDVRRAEHALSQAQAELEHTHLTVPFDGVIATVKTQVGEWAVTGVPIVEVLDLSRWRIETKNIGELEIGKVRVGQTATVRVNAFQGEVPLQGRIATISPISIVQQGDTTYTVVIEIEPTDLNLRPGMTAQIEIGVTSDP